MPTASIRTASAVRLVTLLSLEAGLANTTVTFGHPGEQNGEAFVCVLVGESGSMERPNFTATRHQAEDNWTLEVHVALFGNDLDEYGAGTSQTVETLAAIVHDVIAENPQLALDGNGLSGLIEARHTAFNGPTLYRLSDGYLAEVQLDLALSARLT